MMHMPFGQTVTRLRRKLTPNPYNPAREIPGAWADADSVTISNAFVASSSSSRARDATRTQILTTKSLYCAPTADVREGDRVRADGIDYEVTSKPSADTSPFSGWQPITEIPLEDVKG